MDGRMMFLGIGCRDNAERLLSSLQSQDFGFDTN